MALEKITKYEDLLKTALSKDIDTIKKTECSSEKQSACNQEQIKFVPKGKPKSGRFWKETKNKFSSNIKTRGTRLSFEKKQKLRQDLKRVKELSKEIKAAKEAEKEAHKERRRENIKRTEENRKKSEIVQVITNTSKLKRMKKKNLRMIEKRDTLKSA